MSILDDINNERVSIDDVQYTPQITFDGDSGTWDTGIIRGHVPDDFGALFREALESSGQDPSKVRLGGVVRQSHWQQRDRVRQWSEQHNSYIQTDQWETVWLHAYRFGCSYFTAATTDIESIVARAKKGPATITGPHWFVFQASDLQIGKRSRDGSTKDIVERYIDSVELAKQKFKQLKRHGIEGIQISMPGDCVEGVVSQNSKNLWLTQEPITEQIRILRRLMMHTIEELAPLANQVYLDVVGGNHDQAQRVQNVYDGDNWATECAIQVRDALAMNKRAYGHVEVRTPNKWSGMMTVPVGNTVVTVVHGHQWSRDKAMDWWAKQALNNQPPGAAHILQHGHWHEFQIRTNEHKTVIGSPTFDCGSDWFRNKQGATAKRGALVYLLNSGEMSLLSLV